MRNICVCQRTVKTRCVALVLCILVLYAGQAPIVRAQAENRVPISAEALVQLSVCPASINLGETIQCSIDSTGEIDTYTFTANAGDKVLVRMSNSSGNLWPYIRIHTLGGGELCEEVSSTTAEIASCLLPGAGTYTILAGDGFNGTYTGSYYLYLQRLNSPGSPVPIAFGQTLSGTIPTPAEMDAFTFSANAGDKVLVRMSRSSGNLWPLIRVYDPAGNLLCEEVSSVTAEIASCPLPGAGTYTLLAGDGFNGTYTGSYSLFLQGSTNPVTATYISQASNDGWILESSESSNKGGMLNRAATTFYLGDDAQKKQYRSILSFTTKSLPDDAKITKVTLRIRKQGIVGGGNPVNTFQGFLVDVRKGFFGSGIGLQASDFQANADKSYGPFKPALKNGWYTFNLTPASANINKEAKNGGVTQIRLRFKLDDNNNAIANFLKLYSGNAPASSRPQLIINYVP